MIEITRCSTVAVDVRHTRKLHDIASCLRQQDEAANITLGIFVI